MKLRQLLNPVLTLLALVSLTSCRPWFPRHVSGEILALEGTAEGTWQGQSIRLTEQSAISAGMTIRVSAGSRLDLLLLPGILLELQPDTEIEIEQLRLSRDGDESIRPMVARQATIRLRNGSLFATVGRVPTRSGLTIKSQTGSVTAGSGRALKVAIDGSKLRIVSARGRVVFSPLNGTPAIKVNPGYFAVLPGPNAAPQPAAESGAQAQKDVAGVIKAEGDLLQLERENPAGFRRWRKGRADPADAAEKM